MMLQAYLKSLGRSCMRVDHQHDSLLPKLLVTIYMLAALAMMFLIYDQFRQGLYSLVLTNAIVIPALLFSSIFIYINREQRDYYSINYVLTALLVAIALYQLPRYPYQIIHFIYAIPLFCFFADRKSTRLNSSHVRISY